MTIESQNMELAAAVNDQHRTRVEQMGRVLALAAITISSFVPLAALASLTSHAISFSFAIPLIVFSQAHFGALPALVMLFCYAGLLRSFFLGPPSMAAVVGRVLLAVTIFAFCIGSGPVNLFFYFSGLIAWFGFCKLGLAMRNALPESFRFDRALVALFMGSLPSLGYITAINMGLLPSHTPVAGHVAHMSLIYLTTVTVILGSSLGLQSFLLARCARTGEFGPLILLSLLVTSPILLSSLMVPLTALFSAELTAYTPVLFLAAILTTGVGAYAASLGAMLGAKVNANRHDYSLESARSIKLSVTKL